MPSPAHDSIRRAHFHALVLDGVYTTPSPLSRPQFHPAGELQGEEVWRWIEAVRERRLRLLRCRGQLSDEGIGEPPEETEPEGVFGELAAASIQGRVALGPSAGCSAARLAFVTSAPSASSSDAPPRCSEREGFSLNAVVRVDANDRERLERLCRYGTRPPIAIERLSVSEDGWVVFGLRRPWRDGTSHVVFEPLDFLSRLTAGAASPC